MAPFACPPRRMQAKKRALGERKDFISAIRVIRGEEFVGAGKSCEDVVRHKASADTFGKASEISCKSCGERVSGSFR